MGVSPGRQGVVEVLEPEMSDDERQALERSAERLKETVRRYVGARRLASGLRPPRHLLVPYAIRALSDQP